MSFHLRFEIVKPRLELASSFHLQDENSLFQHYDQEGHYFLEGLKTFQLSASYFLNRSLLLLLQSPQKFDRCYLQDKGKLQDSVCIGRTQGLCKGSSCEGDPMGQR